MNLITSSKNTWTVLRPEEQNWILNQAPFYCSWEFPKFALFSVPCLYQRLGTSTCCSPASMDTRVLLPLEFVYCHESLRLNMTRVKKEHLKLPVATHKLFKTWSHKKRTRWHSIPMSNLQSKLSSFIAICMLTHKKHKHWHVQTTETVKMYIYRM